MGSGCSICAGRKPAKGESFSELYPDLSQYLLKDERNKVDAHTTPIGSHAKLVTDCLECKKIIKKEVRNWVKVYKTLGAKSYICNKCRYLVKFNNELVSLDHLQEVYGLPKGLIKGRLGHGSTVENALNAGPGATNPKVFYNNKIYKIPDFCEKYYIELDLLKDKIGKEPISDILKSI